MVELKEYMVVDEEGLKNKFKEIFKGINSEDIDDDYFYKIIYIEPIIFRGIVCDKLKFCKEREFNNKKMCYTDKYINVAYLWSNAPMYAEEDMFRFSCKEDVIFLEKELM